MKQEKIEYLPINLFQTAHQVRKTMHKERLQELTDNIRDIGILHPIRVRKVGNKFIIVSGARRFQALIDLGETNIPVIIEDDGLNDGDILQRMMSENTLREDLTPIEMASGISQLMAVSGCNATQAGAKLGLSNATTARYLALLTLPDDVQKKVDSGEIPASAGYELARIKDPDEQARRAEEILHGGLTRDQLARANKSRSKGPNKKDSVALVRAVAVLGDNKSVTVTAPELDMPTFQAILEDCLARVKNARRLGGRLRTVMNLLQDQNASSKSQLLTLRAKTDGSHK